MEEMVKYGRSLHSPISKGTTSDDRFIPEGYVKVFSDFDDLIFSEKLDGQNNCMKKDGVFARSHTSPSVHPWDKPIWDRWELLKRDLKDLELFGESMAAVHSIKYDKLESYYYLFGIRCKGTWLSWEEVKFWTELFDLPVVPTIEIKYKLKDIYDKNPKQNENIIFAKFIELNLGMTWEEYVETEGALGGYDPNTGNPVCEGFVIKTASEYKINNGFLDVHPNEFDSLVKIVRSKHVKTDVHWTKTWEWNKLKENKFGFYSK